MVAKNSVDDILWPLIEEKLRILGEIVEGVKNQSMTFASSEYQETKSGKSDDDDGVVGGNLASSIASLVPPPADDNNYSDGRPSLSSLPSPPSGELKSIVDELAAEDRDRPSDADVEIEEVVAEVEVIETAIREKGKDRRSHLQRNMLRGVTSWNPQELNKHHLYSSSSHLPTYFLSASSNQVSNGGRSGGFGRGCSIGVNGEGSWMRQPTLHATHPNKCQTTLQFQQPPHRQQQPHLYQIPMHLQQLQQQQLQLQHADDSGGGGGLLGAENAGGARREGFDMQGLMNQRLRASLGLDGRSHGGGMRSGIPALIRPPPPLMGRSIGEGHAQELQNHHGATSLMSLFQQQQQQQRMISNSSVIAQQQMQAGTRWGHLQHQDRDHHRREQRAREDRVVDTTQMQGTTSVLQQQRRRQQQQQQRQQQPTVDGNNDDGNDFFIGDDSLNDLFAAGAKELL